MSQAVVKNENGPDTIVISGKGSSPPAENLAGNKREIADPSDGLLAVILRAASDPNVDIEKFERLLAMREKLEVAQEKKDFNLAVANAKAEIAPILKKHSVDYATDKGRTSYKHEDLADIAKAIDAPLGKHGLSYRFRASQEAGQGDAKRVAVTCIVSRGGYSEETTLSAFEDHSGGKNKIQAIVSTATYLQRATLKLALGLAAGRDDDGIAAGGDQSSGNSNSSAPSKADQLAELEALIIEANPDPATIPAFTADVLHFVKVKSLQEMTPDHIKKAVRAIRQQLEDERKAQAKQGAAA